MSQEIFEDIVPIETSGPELAEILNKFKAAILSGFSGVARPTELQAGGYWIDVTDDATDIWKFKIYNGTSDLEIFQVNKATGALTFADGAFSTVEATTLNVSGESDLTNAAISGTLNVVGETTLSNAEVSGNATIGGTLEVTGQTSLEEVNVGGSLVVDGNLTVQGTTTSVNSTTLEVADSNIAVNKDGNQASADLNKAGLTVEMSDAPHARMGYDSTKASKFVIGEVGSEKEIIDSSSAQEISNKAIVSPSILEPKQDTYANLVTYATTATDGQLCWASDTNSLYQVSGGILELIPHAKYVPPSVEIPALDIDWTQGFIFAKDITANSDFTFSNVVDGKVISFIVKNSGAVPVTITLPALKGKDLPFEINAGVETVYTFMSAGSYGVYASAIAGVA